MGEPAYRRVVVKVSGEYLAGDQSFGIHQPTIDRIAGDLIKARELGVEIAVVVGGGNIFRGVEVSSRGVSRTTGDTMGMLATIMNCLALESALERKGQSARALSAFVMPQVCELFTRGAAHKYLAAGRIILLAGGTGNPYFTTDTTAVLRAAEIGAQFQLALNATRSVWLRGYRRMIATALNRDGRDHAIDLPGLVLSLQTLQHARHVAMVEAVHAAAQPALNSFDNLVLGHGSSNL